MIYFQPQRGVDFEEVLLCVITTESGMSPFHKSEDVMPFLGHFLRAGRRVGQRTSKRPLIGVPAHREACKGFPRAGDVSVAPSLAPTHTPWGGGRCLAVVRGTHKRFRGGPVQTQPGAATRRARPRLASQPTYNNTHNPPTTTKGDRERKGT